MADNVKTIGSQPGDNYASWTAWEAAIGSNPVNRPVGRAARAETITETAFTMSFTDASQVGAKMEARLEEGAYPYGIRGSGHVISVTGTFTILNGMGDILVEGLEIRTAFFTLRSTSTKKTVFHRCILQTDNTNTIVSYTYNQANSWIVYHGCLMIDNSPSGSTHLPSPANITIEFFACSCLKTQTSGIGVSWAGVTGSGTKFYTVKNTILHYTGTAVPPSTATTAWVQDSRIVYHASCTDNTAPDEFAPGTNPVINQLGEQWYVDETLGAEDLHLHKSKVNMFGTDLFVSGDVPDNLDIDLEEYAGWTLGADYARLPPGARVNIPGRRFKPSVNRIQTLRRF